MSRVETRSGAFTCTVALAAGGWRIAEASAWRDGYADPGAGKSGWIGNARMPLTRLGFATGRCPQPETDRIFLLLI
jgi:hypothetical protein